MTDGPFKLHVAPREGGFLYVTSRDLPGFRVLARAETMEEAVSEAFSQFYPLWKASEARREAMLPPRRLRIASAGPVKANAEYDVCAKLLPE
ncbi:MAG: hypothetical protein WDN04_20865 [Rhodospirillales bacterium]